MVLSNGLIVGFVLFFVSTVAVIVAAALGSLFHSESILLGAFRSTQKKSIIVHRKILFCSVDHL